jgi:Flp pilus assembly protein CpaB
MEMEYKDPSRRGRYVVLLGLLLAIAAGAAAFFLINNAQQQAGRSDLKYVTGVVAVRPLAAKAIIAADDVQVRNDIPLDGTNSMTNLVPTSTDQVIGRILAVDVAQGQLVTLNLLASSTAGGQFSILGPNETVGPDSDAWRAVSITVSDDRAVGGLLTAGMTVDVIMTTVVTPPQTPAPTGSPAATPWPYVADASTKVTYQDMTILARQGTYYVLKATLPVAEEISHIQAAGAAQFSMVLRPDQDTRILDVSGLGATTSRIIQRYGLLFPQVYPLNGQFPSQPPVAPITPAPTLVPSPGASGAPSPSPSG